MSNRAIAFFVAALLLSAPTLAGPQDQGKADIATLKERYAEVQRRAPVATKLSAADYERLSKQERQVDALIDRMEAGQPVTIEEMDRALGLAR